MEGNSLSWKYYTAALLAGLNTSVAVIAGEVPLYQPTPDWIVPAKLPEIAEGSEAPSMLLLDGQQRIAGAALWSYVDTAQRITSTEQLNQLANLTLPWLPDKGDLIIHELSILRGKEAINLLAGGKTFTVLRREQSLEQRELTGILTATMAVEGLRVGDILRVRYSTTSTDKALGGKVQALAPIVAAPFSIASGRLRASWENGVKANWRVLGSGITGKPVRGKDFTELSFTLPAPKQPEMPDDAPRRYRIPPLLEVSTFADWQDVSRTMAPLFATEGLIRQDSPLQAEIQAIMKAEATPLGRTQRALQLVQDKVRYLAVSMDGGNYVPQTPEQTWSMRYGDCKAKTLLLLSLLRAMGIEAEPVLAHADLGDLVPQRLPSAAAFNHILVRATVDGQSLWLDGTGLGSRLEDIHDTPPFRNVLPLRAEGADLLAIEPQRDARPSYDLALNVDESTSVDLPSVLDVTLVVRGGAAMSLNLVRSRLDAKRQREVFTGFLSRMVGEAQFGRLAIASDDAAGQLTIKARAVTKSPWRWDDKAMRRALARAPYAIDFSPDRARAAWSTIPVATPAPQGRRSTLVLRLPDGGTGFKLDGQADITDKVAGYEIGRTVALDKGIVRVDERVDTTGAEVPAQQIGIEKDKLATLRARSPRLIAPSKTVRAWDLAGKDPGGATQLAGAEQILAEAIAEEPEEIGGYVTRGYLRRAVGNGKAAIADFSKAIELKPDISLYLARATLQQEQGNLAAALTDAEAARQLDLSSVAAVAKVAELRAEQGNLNGALELLDQRIDLGGETRQPYRELKASLIGRYGNADEALKLVETMIADRPGTPRLLNMRCWIKGTRNTQVDTATKDCTSALELSENPYQILDSRALVAYRLGRYDEAIRDLDAVLAAVPGLAESRYMRGVVLARLDRKAESDADLQIARRIRPRIDLEYASYGIKP